MKRNKIIFILLLLAFAFMAVGQRGRITGSIRKVVLVNWMAWRSASTYVHQVAGYHIVSDTTTHTYGWAVNDTLGRAVKVRFLLNTLGSTVKKGDVVIWDQTELVLCDTFVRTGAVDTLVLTLSGETEQNPLDVLTVTMGIGNACSLEITGISYTQTATVETTIHASDGSIFSAVEWDTLSQVRLLGSDAGDSCAVFAYQQSCFTTTTSDDDVKHCGVVFSDSIQDNKWGLIAYEGRMDSVECDATSVTALVGLPVTTSNTAKHCEPRADASAGDVIGRCLESDNTNSRISVWLGGR